MSYEYLIDPSLKNCSVREDLFRLVSIKDQNEPQIQEENDDLSDKEEFKYVKSIFKKGNFFFEYLSVNIVS